MSEDLLLYKVQVFKSLSLALLDFTVFLLPIVSTSIFLLDLIMLLKLILLFFMINPHIVLLDTILS